MPGKTRDGMTEDEVLTLCDSTLNQIYAIENGSYTIDKPDFIKLGNRLFIAFAHWKDCSFYTRQRITSAVTAYQREANLRGYHLDDDLYDVVTKLRTIWMENAGLEYRDTVNNSTPETDSDFDASQLLADPVCTSDFSLGPESSENPNADTNIDNNNVEGFEPDEDMEELVFFFEH